MVSKPQPQTEQRAGVAGGSSYEGSSSLSRRGGRERLSAHQEYRQRRWTNAPLRIGQVLRKEGRKGGRKEGRKAGRQEGRKERRVRESERVARHQKSAARCNSGRPAA